MFKLKQERSILITIQTGPLTTCTRITNMGCNNNLMENCKQYNFFTIKTFLFNNL